MRFIIRLPITILILLSGIVILLFGLITQFTTKRKEDDLELNIAMETGKNIGFDFVESNKKLLDVVNFILWLIIISISIKFILN